MKILHVSNNLGSGGSEKLLTAILPQLKAAGNEVHLACATAKGNVDHYEQELKRHGVELIYFNSSWYHPGLVIKLIRLLRNEQYDIVHAHIFPTQYWLALASFLKPGKTQLIKTEHNVLNNRRKKVFWPMEKIVYSRYASIIAVTEEVAKALKAWLGTAAIIVVIPNGVNLKQISSSRQEGGAVDYSFLKAGNFNILMTARFKGKAKDHGTLIKALRLLPSQFHVYFAGEGHLMAEAKELVSRLGLAERVHFLGLWSDIYSLMSKVDLNVLSTRYEGLSGVTLEGLASGKPFLGADVTGVNTIVPDGRFLFPAENSEMLASKIVALAENTSRTAALVDLSLAHVQRYDIKEMGKKYLEHYASLINKH